MILVATALIVRIQKSATIREREQETDQNIVEEMKKQGRIFNDLETTDDDHERLNDLNREVDSMMEDIFGPHSTVLTLGAINPYNIL